MKKQNDVPFWVYLALLGINSRKTAIFGGVAAFFGSIFLLIPQSVLPTKFDYTIIGVICIFYVVALCLAIRWTDNHSKWT
ncbi:MAG: hypothetical protein AB8B92_06585 [Gammaproteobacteria bacterium]